MAFRTGSSWLWPLVILLFCSTLVTTSLITNSPRTYWLDQTCIEKTRTHSGTPSPFTVEVAQESLYMAYRGSRRLLNRLDGYVPWLFQFLFKIRRPTVNLLSDSTPWLVIRKELSMLPLLDAFKHSNPPPRSFRLDFRNDEHSREGDCRRLGLLW